MECGILNVDDPGTQQRHFASGHDSDQRDWPSTPFVRILRSSSLGDSVIRDSHLFPLPFLLRRNHKSSAPPRHAPAQKKTPLGKAALDTTNRLWLRCGAYAALPVLPIFLRASSTMASNASGSAMAISLSILRLSVMFDSFRPLMNLL